MTAPPVAFTKTTQAGNLGILGARVLAAAIFGFKKADGTGAPARHSLAAMCSR
ncbi:hypothetical protein ACFS23_14060 [Ralstonia solanacearum]|uniref:hypothetical protein n=1 Tax=Ralstonia solanacearum TaxID=305 RepID=UPI001B3B4237|nr:hypothetical protein [Ralstonia solanacearum]MDB0511667.1 hypothetical protein [Ralstonia solanacearum]MDB0516260.1 hypothetical protein [Ralstonia solanacearum]QTY24954.1 hypothetical protein CDC46_26770 [Ralstonia solanacearum]